MRDILLLVLTGGLSIAALFRPLLGILAYFSYTFLAPYSYTWGVAKDFPHIQALAACTIVGYILRSEKFVPRAREVALLLALWGVFILSTVTAFDQDAAVPQLLRISKILLMTVLCLSMVNSPEHFRLLIKVVALTLGLYALKSALFVTATGGQSTVWGPEGTVLANSNSIGLALAVNAPMLYYLARNESHKWLRFLMQSMFVSSYLAVICTFSRGAWLGLAAATGLIIVRSKRRVLIIAVACICGVLAGSFAAVTIPERVLDRFDELVNYDKNEAGTAQERLSSWEMCTRVGMGNPLLGAGFDFVSADVYMQYMPEHVEYWTRALQSGANRDRVAWSCHNSWLTILAEHGVLGILLLVMLLGSCVQSAQRVREFGRTHGEHEWIVGYADMLTTALIVYVLSGTFLDAGYYDQLYFLVGSIIIMKSVAQQMTPPKAASSIPIEMSSCRLDPRQSTSVSV
jgi:probable O-glycosylation ligase (exosortase A-associated)